MNDWREVKENFKGDLFEFIMKIIKDHEKQIINFFECFTIAVS